MAKLVFLDVNSCRFYIYPNQIRGGPLLLASMAKRAGHDVRIFGTVGGMDWQAIREADIIFMGGLSSSVPFAYPLAKQLRQMGKTVVFGGTHATTVPDEAIEHFDYVVRGEGEPIILGLIDALVHNGDLSAVPGLSWHHNGDVIHNERYRGVIPLDQARDFSLIRHSPDDYHRKVRFLMFSRGCPNACHFCSLHVMFPGRVRYADIDMVLGEIRGYKSDVVVVDDNIYTDPERCLEIVRRMRPRMANRKINIQAPINMAFDDRVMAELAKYENPPTITLGLESCTEETLDEYNKPVDIKMTEEALRAFKRWGVKLVGMFVLGGDSDGPDCVQKTVDFAIRNRVDYVSLYALTPFPGTRLRKELVAQNRILPVDWSYYDAAHVAFLPRHLTPARLQQEITHGYNRFYSRPRYLMENLHHLYKFPNFYMKLLIGQLQAGRLHPALIQASRERYRGDELIV